MANTILQGARPGNRRRKPKTYSEGRVCASDACTTHISRYNKAEHCYKHRPVHFPRMRGVFTDEYQAQANG